MIFSSLQVAELSGYRIMWVITFFDLPVLTKSQRRDATEFRKDLLRRGFQMAQLSVYMKYCKDRSQADVVVRDIMRLVPLRGKVDILLITDKQYSNITTISSAAQLKRENPEQLAFF